MFIIKSIVTKIIFYIDCLIKKNNNFYAFSSYPDLTDNSYAMFKYIYQNWNMNSKFIWLLSDISKIKLYKKMLLVDLLIQYEEQEKNIIFVKKNSIKGLYWYVKSKYVFFTHGLFNKVEFPDSHILINLWHGMPLKNIGKMDGKNDVPQFTFSTVTSKIYQDIMSKSFGVSKEKVLITGQPRCDLLFENKNTLNILNIKKDKYKKIIFWAPTYRQSIIGDIRCDGEQSLGFPLLLLSNMEDFNNYIKELNIFLIIKLHPMDVLNLHKIESFSNILVLNNEQLLEKSLQLYNILGEVDMLITDYSSIYIDYLLLNKPILFAFEDLESFKKSRGFVFDNIQNYMPGKLVFNLEELKKELSELSLKNKDDFVNERVKINNLFNEYGINSSEEIFNFTNSCKGFNSLCI